ncbi:DUF2252 family protein [Streptomyces noursei]|uniref:DUF2252 family protein n=1 Tax=Streptomyces noursei TaxID=1971 RepID=UPI00045EE3CB|nr:DUF2252 family protein [Streptomyces noursei]AIA03048.1 hypothetical protein DC74_2544 [Streptomyces noursei]
MPIPHAPARDAARPGQDAARRDGQILAALDGASGPALRRMAACPAAFFRGAAALFHRDLAAAGAGAPGAPYLDERTGRIWVHGDLHAGSFGTYLDATGRLVFGVTGSGEAYVGPFTWDLLRCATSVALLGRARGLGDAGITELVRSFADAYREHVRALASGADAVPPATLDTADGPLLAALRTARARTRARLLAPLTELCAGERRFAVGSGTVELDAAARYTVLAAFDGYLETLAETGPSRPEAYRVKDVVGRRGTGPADAIAYDLLLEGASDVLESDVVLTVRPVPPPALARHRPVPEVAAHVRHEGHRAVLARRALQAHADPWLGWTALADTGLLVGEESPYAVGLDWSALDDPAEFAAAVAGLGRVTAAAHAAGDGKERHPLVPFRPERAVDAAIAADEDGFGPLLADAAHAAASRARADHRIFVELLREDRFPGR